MVKNITGKNRVIRAIALSQISLMILEIFSFAFIMAMMFSGVGMVSGLTEDEFNGAPMGTIFTSLDSIFTKTATTDINSNQIATWKDVTEYFKPEAWTWKSIGTDSGSQISSQSPVSVIPATANSIPTSHEIYLNAQYRVGTPTTDTTVYYLEKNGKTYSTTYSQSTRKFSDATESSLPTNAEKLPTSQESAKPQDTKTPPTPNTFDVKGSLWDGLKWAGVVLGITQAIGALMGGEKGEQIATLGLAITAGIETGNLLYTAIKGFNIGDGGNAEGIKGFIGRHATGISVGVGILVAYLIAANNIKSTKEKEVTVSFKCYQWQAPNGGNSCTRCNDDPQMPCSEYRCKALGQTCKLLNAGSGSEMCIDGSRNDVTSPGIIPDESVLTSGLSYTDVTERPPGGAGPAGMTITGTADEGCIPAFTPFEFGIKTTDNGDNGVVNQPAQCKVDYNHTASFDDMDYYMSDNNLYIINHSQVMMLPGTDLLNTIYDEANGTLQVQNDGNYNLYIRCKDGNGNENEDEFNVRFCIDKTPDTQSPQIKATNINSGSGVKYQADNVSIEVYTNEPSTCRWSRKDASYTNMENNMSCSNKIWQVNAENLYTCATILTSIKDREDNNFYFRCEDLKKHTMQQSYPFVLRGSQPLTLLRVGPSGIVGGATSTVTAVLEAYTDNGLDNGKATCYFSTIPNKTEVEFVNTGTTTHTQPLDLTNGEYTYYITCIDDAGNSASNSTKFTIYVDKDAPIVLRAYTYESKVVLRTNEDSTCRYSNTDCNFDLTKLEGTAMPYDETTTHSSEFDISKTYYVKCKDKHDNQPFSQCSFIVRPFSLAVA